MSIAGTEVHRIRDEEGAIIVYDSTEIRILAFDTPVEQSCLAKSAPWRLHYPYTQAMMLGPLFMATPGSAAVLGLGGGSLVRALRHAWPEMHITAVEKRRAVAEVARDWFMITDDPRLEIVVADAGEWLAGDVPRQDLIFTDIYDHAGMVAQQTETDYLRSCMERLSDEGVLIINLWSNTVEEANAHREALRSAFGERVLRVSVQGGNSIALAFRDRLPRPRAREFMNAAQRLGLRLDIPLQRHARRLWGDNAARLPGR